ncbi:MAG: PDZ domain-containing protein [Beutenbergiaceae bacterium]
MSTLLLRLGITPRFVTMVLAGAVTLLLLLWMLLRPVPYVVQAAGPTFNTLGDIDEVPLITVDGARTYATSGKLLLTTVTTAGGPEYPVYVGNVVAGWLTSDKVVPVETVFDPSQTRQELDDASQAQMISSQENATVAALTELGYRVPAELTIVGAQQGLGADGVVREGDEIAAIETTGGQVAVETYNDLAQVLADTPPGSTVTLTVRRDGEARDLDIVTADDGSGGSVIGVFLDAEFDYPVDVEIQIDNVGGPSAGTMFALGIIDVLTPGELTGGEVVAGTGTISLGGAVGSIGGIRHKLAGAGAAGAEYFLAPASNCDEVIGYVPAGLQVIAVTTLAQARDAVESIGQGQAQDLPGC